MTSHAVHLLVIERELSVRDLLRALFHAHGTGVSFASNLPEALALLASETIDLIVLRSGFWEVEAARLRDELRLRWPGVPVVVLPEVGDTSALPHAVAQGTQRLVRALVDFAYSAASLHPSEVALPPTREVAAEVGRLSVQALRWLVRSAERLSPHTQDRSRRAAEYGAFLADALKQPGADRLQTGGELYDIGKLAVPAAILGKPGRLSSGELATAQLHAVLGMRILRPLVDDETILSAATWHHERWDGSGYPDGLHGDRIPLPAQIMAVADRLEALTSPRVYRPALRWEDAVAQIRRQAGKDFSPAVVGAFLEIEDRLKKVKESISLVDFAPPRSTHG
ncbi:MAG: HD domain-containing protein [Gemmatimonadetes bacterium]|nr:HD domain-containing protein [Gemmatimonadota bacterium]